MEKKPMETVCPKTWKGQELDTIEKINQWYEENIWSKLCPPDMISGRKGEKENEMCRM